jgi:signal transduction histidine kinase
MNTDRKIWQHRLIGLRWWMGTALVLSVFVSGGVYSPLVGLLVLEIALLALLLDARVLRWYVGMVLVALTAAFIVTAGIDPAREMLTGTVWLLTIIAAALFPARVLVPQQESENHLAALADQHRRTVEALQAAEKQRSQFVRVVTHELRSPVVGAQSLLRVLLANMGGTLTDSQRDILGRVNARMDGLLTLIHDLLALAAATHSPDQALEAVDLAALVASDADTWRYQAQDKQQTITFEARPQSIVIRAEATGVKRVLENLIGNAIKYTPAQGVIRVRLRVEQDQAVLEVQDSGIGIPAEALTQIGEEFFRAANAKASGITGTGLGLATVRQLVERFGGTMQVDSVVGQGTTFTLRFALQA